LQGVADEQHDIGAHTRFARRREHDAGFAQTVEFAYGGAAGPIDVGAAQAAEMARSVACATS
jgi:hypothetical protein